MGFATMSAALGAAAGPTIGGWLAGWFSWRLIFLINVPLGLAAIPLGIMFLPSDTKSKIVRRFDWPGAILSTTGILLFILALNQAHELGWRSWPILSAFFLSLICSVAFFLWEMRAESPLVAPVFFLDRNLFMLWAVFGFSLMTAGGLTFVFPFLVVDYLGFGSAVAGLAMIVIALGQIIGPWAGDLAGRFGVRRICLIGLLAGAFSFVLFLFINGNSGLVLAVAALTVFGLSQGLNNGLNLHLIMDYAPEDKKGVAGGLSSLVRSMSLALGVVVFETVFSHYVPLIHGSLRPHSHLLLGGFRAVFVAGLLLSIAAWAAMLMIREKPVK